MYFTAKKEQNALHYAPAAFSRTVGSAFNNDGTSKLAMTSWSCLLRFALRAALVDPASSSSLLLMGPRLSGDILSFSLLVAAATVAPASTPNVAGTWFSFNALLQRTVDTSGASAVSFDRQLATSACGSGSEVRLLATSLVPAYASSTTSDRISSSICLSFTALVSVCSKTDSLRPNVSPLQQHG